jgi:hypothetical protein
MLREDFKFEGKSIATINECSLSNHASVAPNLSQGRCLSIVIDLNSKAISTSVSSGPYKQERP